MHKYPPLSIVVVTMNNRRTVVRFAEAIRKQRYPKKMIECINVDGGSTDGTTEVLRKYGFRTVKSRIRNNAEAQRAIGLQEAKNNLIVSIDADNYLPCENWLTRMVEPFVENPDVVHAATMHYAYRKDDTPYNRYCALFGVLDPVVLYVGRPDREMLTKRTVTHGNFVSETEHYYIVNYSSDTLPTVGCNGVCYRKDLLVKHARSSPDEFLHIDVFADLVRAGYRTFAVVKTDIYHDTAISIRQLLKKRIAFLEGYYLSDSGKRPERRYLIFDPGNIRDMFRLIVYVVYTVSVLKPLYDAYCGYRKIRDRAWFLHPIMCWVYLLSYGYATARQYLTKQ